MSDEQTGRELVRFAGGVLQPVKPLMGNQWMLGVIESHQARPLTRDEIDEVIARLAARDAELARVRAERDGLADDLRIQAELRGMFQRRAEAAERRVRELERALKYGLRIIASTNKSGDKLDQLHYLLTSAALNPTPATNDGEQANGDRRCLRLYTRDNLPADGWAKYRKVPTTRMVRIDGPFSVRTRHRGIVTCEDGYLAVDSGGWPYPIAADEHARIYAPAEPEPTPPIPAAVREALERVAREAKDYLDVLDNAPDEASTSELRQALSALPPASGEGERGGVEAPEPRKGCA